MGGEIKLDLICYLWGFAGLFLKDESLLDCDFDENVFSSMLDDDFALVSNVARGGAQECWKKLKSPRFS